MLMYACLHMALCVHGLTAVDDCDFQVALVGRTVMSHFTDGR